MDITYSSPSRWHRLTAQIDGKVCGWLEWPSERDEYAPGEITSLTVVILQMLATVSDIPADDQEMLFRRYLTLILAGLRPAGEPLPGTAPSPAQAREAMRPRRLVRG